MSNIMDYFDKFPGQYEGDQQRYARGMDDYHRKLDMIALREKSKHYDDLDISDKKDVEGKVDMQGKGSRKGGTYSDALQAHEVYHGYNDWENTTFVPEDEALEVLSDIAIDEGKTVDTLVSEMSEFRRNSNPDRLGVRKGSVYQLDNGAIVNEDEAKEYQENYGNMMDQAWEEHKRKKRIGNPIKNINPKLAQSAVGKNVSKLVTNRLTK